MVSDVQHRLTRKCWTDAGAWLPEDAEAIEELIAPNKEILACLGEVPTHCAVISAYQPQQAAWGIKDNKCSTHCKPEKCGCSDEACKPHE